jgi:DNA-binding NtrC family response regulator
MTHFRTAAAETAVPEAMVDAGPTLLIGSSVLMAGLRETVLQVAALDAPVLVTGEPGSGKSLVARALHNYGQRAAGPIVVMGCHGVPQTLLELELFGSPDGVSGATTVRSGALEAAANGTVILENIDKMDVRTQGVLSRVLSSSLLRTADACRRDPPVCARLIGTVSKQEPFDSEIDWHPDLRELLIATTVRVPNLRERESDIPVLTDFFAAAASPLRSRAVFSSEALRALARYSWPGNVAQLRSVVERIVSAEGHKGEIPAIALPVGIRPRPILGRRKSAPDASLGVELFARLRTSRESFWSTVYPLFMSREITRADLRGLMRCAAHATKGNMDELMRTLNIPLSDRGKLERFLRKYDCANR